MSTRMSVAKVDFEPSRIIYADSALLCELSRGGDTLSVMDARIRERTGEIIDFPFATLFDAANKLANEGMVHLRARNGRAGIGIEGFTRDGRSEYVAIRRALFRMLDLAAGNARECVVELRDVEYSLEPAMCRQIMCNKVAIVMALGASASYPQAAAETVHRVTHGMVAFDANQSCRAMQELRKMKMVRDAGLIYTGKRPGRLGRLNSNGMANLRGICGAIGRFLDI